jgi:hypothetical protein
MWAAKLSYPPSSFGAFQYFGPSPIIFRSILKLILSTGKRKGLYDMDCVGRLSVVENSWNHPMRTIIIKTGS